MATHGEVIVGGYQALVAKRRAERIASMAETEEIIPHRNVSHGPYDLRAGEPARVDPQTAAMLISAGLAARGGQRPHGAVTPEDKLPEVTTPEDWLPPEVAVKSSARRRGRRGR